MRYLIGIDGGSSKTKGLLSDHTGRILAEYTASGSNYHLIGREATRQILESVIQNLLKSAGLKKDQLSFAMLALSGADLPLDFKNLNEITAVCLPGASYEVTNDVWAIMRSGLRQPWGGVLICGTGSNAGITRPDEQRFILRALTYKLGNYGGGGDMATEALHYMFRADELTYKPTLLSARLPALLGCDDPPAVLNRLFPVDHVSLEDYNRIPPLVFELASEGDEVCLEILERMGRTQGQLFNGVARQAGIKGIKLPIVIGGSLFNGSNPTLVDAMLLEIHTLLPEAYLVKSPYPPAAGALLLGLDRMNRGPSETIYEHLNDYFL